MPRCKQADCRAEWPRAPASALQGLQRPGCGLLPGREPPVWHDDQRDARGAGVAGCRGRRPLTAARSRVPAIGGRSARDAEAERCAAWQHVMERVLHGGAGNDHECGQGVPPIHVASFRQGDLSGPRGAGQGAQMRLSGGAGGQLGVPPSDRGRSGPKCWTVSIHSGPRTAGGGQTTGSGPGISTAY